MSKSVVACETCGVVFELGAEVTSSRVLCPACAAKRRAALRSAKTTGAQPPDPAPTAKAAAAAPPPTARSARAAGAAGAASAARQATAARTPVEHIDVKEMREAAQKRLVRLGWSVVGGLTLVTAGVLFFVKNAQDSRKSTIATYEKSLDDFRDNLMRIDLNNEDQLKRAKDLVAKERKLWRLSRIDGDVTTQLTKINASLQTIEKTRSLVEQLTGIENQLVGSPNVDTLGKLFNAVRDADLALQANEAGGALKTRFDTVMKTTIRQYIDALRAATTASPTTREALLPYGPLEDALRTVLEAAMATNDVEMQTLYRPVYSQVVREVDAAAATVFTDANQEQVPWRDLLADTTGWTLVSSPSFSHKFVSGLTLTNSAAGDGASGGLSYTPGSGWRDYALDIEVRLDSGSLVFYGRIEDKMDSKVVPAFTMGTTKNPNVLVEYGKTYAVVVRLIGRQLTVQVDGQLVYNDDLSSTKSRKGEPGVVAQVGTVATITKFRARQLR